MTDATLPAAVPLRLPPRSAYATPSSKSSKSTQRLESSLTYYPIRPFVPLHVCMKDLTADIFHGRGDVGKFTPAAKTQKRCGHCGQIEKTQYPCGFRLSAVVKKKCGQSADKVRTKCGQSADKWGKFQIVRYE